MGVRPLVLAGQGGTERNEPMADPHAPAVARRSARRRGGVEVPSGSAARRIDVYLLLVEPSLDERLVDGHERDLLS